jgi:hypothetical protein
LQQLADYLGADDARAEDVFADLEIVLAGSVHEAHLAMISRALDEIEYHAAIAPLAELARALGVPMTLAANTED